MKKLTFEEIMDRYEELVNDEYEFPSFSSYYVTDNDCDGTKEKPYKLKCLCFVLIAPKNKKKKTINIFYQKNKKQISKIY